MRIGLRELSAELPAFYWGNWMCITVQDSLGGNSKTTIIATISPSSWLVSQVSDCDVSMILYSFDVRYTSYVLRSEYPWFPSDMLFGLAATLLKPWVLLNSPSAPSSSAIRFSPQLKLPPVELLAVSGKCVDRLNMRFLCPKWPLPWLQAVINEDASGDVKALRAQIQQMKVLWI